MKHAATTSQVTILPGGDQVAVAAGATLLDACRQAGVLIDAECDGKGQCGKCRLIVIKCCRDFVGALHHA